MMDLKEKIKKVVSVHSPSGAEDVLRSYLKEMLSYHADRINEDDLGNLIIYKDAVHKDGAKTIMLIAHMDEVALMISNIGASGYARVVKVGGVDVNIMRGRNVVILHDDQEVPGVIGTIPAHMLKEAPKKDWEFADLWIDLGYTNAREAAEHVSVGDYVLMDVGYRELANNCICAKACDNKAGVVVLWELLEKISSNNDLCANVVLVFSAQEEVGLRGAEVAAFSIRPDVCIAIDEAHASDYPNICVNKYGDIRIGGGPVVPIGTSFSSQVQKSIMQVAQNSGMPFQRLALPSFSGTEATAVQTSGAGCLTGLVSIPCRYMHSPVEVVSSDDIENCADLLYKYVIQFGSNK